MVITIRKALILTAVAATSAYAAAIPRSNLDNTKADPCALLASLDLANVKLNHVADCYHAIPYDKQRDGNFLANLSILYDNFYVYKDLALSIPGAPFDIPSVDILADFKEIAAREYKNGYDFHNDLRLAFSRLHDAHTSYYVRCYRAYYFTQPIALYAPVIDGKQSIRVFADETNQNLRDCEVVSIDDGEPFKYLQTWADKHTAFSKDPGVRLNTALASMKFDADTKSFRPDLGMFHSRDFLPDKPSVKYELSCPQSQGGRPRAVNLDATFKVHATFKDKRFYDTASFLNFCTGSSNGQDATAQKNIKAEAIWFRFPHIEQQQNRVRIARRADPTPPPSFQHADLIYGTKKYAMYQLKGDPSVGIVHISTMMVANNELNDFVKGLYTLASKNVTRIILDLTSNGGGYGDFSNQLVALFFKTPSDIQGTHVGDLPSSAAVAKLGIADFANKRVTTFYDPEGFVDVTGAPVTDSIFRNPVQYTRGGRTSKYTPPIRVPWRNIARNARFPWSDDTSKIKILTDGKCGSACGMSTDQFVTKHGVDVYVVGGYRGRTMSMFSFTGASGAEWEKIFGFHLDLNISAPMGAPAYAGYITVPWIELYSQGDSIPLDYNNERYPAKYHLDYTPDNARHQDSLWKEVANAAWGK
ncbi:hypothetical protein BGW42_005740 [Actinomortierella wolfii]|nr:hypothetical protein BGW42_005740 [Actinomortierella wolfii]